VSRRYPFPYGFVIDTLNGDGGRLDCFVITTRALRTGDVIECEAIGLMEQTEDDLTDRNVLARVGAEQPELNEVHSTLTEFVQNVFGHMPGRTVVAGRFLGRETAEAEIAKCRVDVDRP